MATNLRHNESKKIAVLEAIARLARNNPDWEIFRDEFIRPLKARLDDQCHLQEDPARSRTDGECLILRDILIMDREAKELVDLAKSTQKPSQTSRRPGP